MFTHLSTKMQTHILVSDQPNLLELIASGRLSGQLLLREVEAVHILHGEQALRVAHYEWGDGEAEGALAGDHPDDAG